jgi:hypothetical protein
MAQCHQFTQSQGYNSLPRLKNAADRHWEAPTGSRYGENVRNPEIECSAVSQSVGLTEGDLIVESVATVVADA